MPPLRRPDRTPPGTPPPRAGRVRIVLRLLDWSEWCREVARGVQRYAHENPAWSLYVASGLPGATPDVFARGHGWDGILTHVLAESVPAIRRILREGQPKVVSFTAAPPRALRQLPMVRVDDAKVAASIGRHLLSGGFRRLAYLSSGRPLPIDDHRAAALEAFAAEAGVPLDSASLPAGSPQSVRTMARWVARLPKPVGVIAWSMPHARRIVEACRSAKVVVPDEVAVVAWDDDALLAESIEPSVTGAVLPTERLGYESAKLLDRLLAGGTPPLEAVLVEPSGVLRVRQSSDVSQLADRDVHLARQLIRENAHRPLHVPELAGTLRVSRRKLEHDFRRVTGTTLNQAIVAAHLERARQLLLETDWPLDRVSEKAGFGTKRHFHRVFSDQERMTPAQYRERYLGI